ITASSAPSSRNCLARSGLIGKSIPRSAIRATIFWLGAPPMRSRRTSSLLRGWSAAHARRGTAHANSVSPTRRASLRGRGAGDRAQRTGLRRQGVGDGAACNLWPVPCPMNTTVFLMLSPGTPILHEEYFPFTEVVLPGAEDG